MKDREVILRYLAFRIFDYEKEYQNDLSDFVENAMKKINLMSDQELNALKKDFNDVMNLTFEFFGNKNFRLPLGKSRGKINIAIFESVSYFFSVNNDQFLEDNKKSIQDNFDKLLENKEYINAVKYGTNSRKKVIIRFNLAQEILGNV
jgi:hypothetical protein